MSRVANTFYSSLKEIKSILASYKNYIEAKINSIRLLLDKEL